MASFVDLFAGGGGASHGITKALGKEPCLAINHNPVALDMHEANHPGTQHLIEDITQVAPTSVLKGRDIAGLWLSPSCTDHTNAGGKKPLRDSVRGLPTGVVTIHSYWSSTTRWKSTPATRCT